MLEGYEISTDPARLQPERICSLMKQTYWANERPDEVTRQAIARSLCFGVYHGAEQVGFARVFTDYTTAYYLCDVIIDEAHRGRGLGKALMEAVIQEPRLEHLGGILATKDAFGLYEKFGFTVNSENYMTRKRQ